MIIKLHSREIIVFLKKNQIKAVPCGNDIIVSGKYGEIIIEVNQSTVECNVQPKSASYNDATYDCDSYLMSYPFFAKFNDEIITFSNDEILSCVKMYVIQHIFFCNNKFCYKKEASHESDI